ncbi:MAG TPA: rod shape-determining protein [Ruminococcaceae bacterium]|nr:rod shape-determining protein [Oscillospiraceae bacterium]
MALMDIGIDLGTTSVLIYTREKGVVLTEPSVIAVDTQSGKVIAVGSEAYKMLGRTPDRIRAVRPLEDGVISDYVMTEEMIKHYVRQVCSNRIFKPRIVFCIPSGTTDVESMAVVDAAIMAGARKIFLIEEPLAAAIGAGINVLAPEGNMIVDIGGGTTDIAVISLGGIVTKTSVKMAGNKFDEAIVRAVKNNHNVLIGEKTGEQVKKNIGSAYPPAEEKTMEIKGRNLYTGFPQKITVTSGEIYDALKELVEVIITAVVSVLDVTPPELTGDIIKNGIYLTGGGSLLSGLDKLISERTGLKCRVADDPVECVAIGTQKCLKYASELKEGFYNPLAKR